jgi:DTW domain-containing protein YfiP
MPVPRCPRCNIPSNACFCSELREVPSRIRVVIVRQAAERNKASNTGILVSRVFGAELVDYGLRGQPVDLTGQLGAAPWLLFPNAGVPDPLPTPSALVVLDATWRQVRGMRHRIPPLATVPSLSLPVAVVRARMREQHRDDGMSTIEAVAGALRLFGDDPAADALERAFLAMTDRMLTLRSHPSRRGPTSA